MRNSIEFTFSAGAGICLSLPQGNVWVDFMHSLPGLHTSSVSHESWEKIKKDKSLKPDIIAFTHRHPDHFTMSMAKEAEELYPDAPILIPPAVCGYAERFAGEDKQIGTEVRGVHREFSFGEGDKNILIKYDTSEHSGEPYKDTPHYCITVCTPDVKVFFAGDVMVADKSAVSILEREKPDIGFFTFPWITTEIGRKTLENCGIKHVMIYHIPFEEDDDIDCRSYALKFVGLIKAEDERVMLRPLQREEIRL